MEVLEFDEILLFVFFKDFMNVIWGVLIFFVVLGGV